MGFALLFVGLLMVITGARGTYAQLGSQIASEFQGPNNFTYWVVALFAIGALGYIQALQKVSRYMMALVLLALFLSHKGFFAQFNAALASGPRQPAQVPAGSAAAASIPNPMTSGSPSGGKPLLDAGPLGTFDPSIAPGSPADTFKKWLGF